MALAPEARARERIDQLLIAAGWHVCDLRAADIGSFGGVAIREFPLKPGFGIADLTCQHLCRPG
jgi:type I restriction enzyme R subunit